MGFERALVDVDGVLLDFYGHWHAMKGLPMPDPYPNIWHLKDLYNVPEDVICSGLTQQWWATMPWMPDGKAILTVIEEFFGTGNTDFCTAVSVPDVISACAGKAQWFEEQMPGNFGRLFMGRQKELLADPDVTLFDDNQGNVTKFRQAGGRAFLVPRPWNTKNPRNALQAILDHLGLGL